MFNLCRQLFVVQRSVRHFRSGVVPRPIGLLKDIERWQKIHTDHIITLLKENKVSEATTYFYKEVKNPTPSIYSLLLSSIGKTGHSRLAYHLFRDMRARDIRPSAAILTSMFNAFANNDENPRAALAGATNLYEQMRIQGWSAGGVTYHAMMKAFAVQGDCDTCFRLLDEMEEKKLPITVITYNHLLMGCIANKEMGYVLAVRVLRFMLWKRIRPNSKTFDFLLKAANDCGCGSDVKVLNRLLNDVRQNQLQDPEIAMISSGESLLDVRLNNQLVAIAYLPNTIEERLQLVGGPEGILSQMNYFKIEPTPVTYTYLLTAYPNEEKVMEFVKSLNPEKLDMGFWNQLLKKCIVEKYSCVDEVIKMIYDRKMKKDNLTYGILAMAAQTPERIKGLLNEMEEMKFAVNEVIMSTLVNNAARRFQWGTLTYLLEYCEQSDIRLNQKALKKLAVLVDRSRSAAGCYSISKFLRRLKTVPADDLKRSRLKQFEPTVWKRDHKRWDPEESEAAQLAREEGIPLKDEDETDTDIDLHKCLVKEDKYAETDEKQFDGWIKKKILH